MGWGPTWRSHVWVPTTLGMSESIGSSIAKSDYLHKDKLPSVCITDITQK